MEVAISTTCPSCGTKNLEGEDACAACGADLRTIGLPHPESRMEQTVMELPLSMLPMAKVQAIAPNTLLGDAIHILVRQPVDILIIVQDGQLAGLLSVRDIVTRVGPDYRQKLAQPVSAFMTPKPETLPPDAPITFALNKMDVGGYRHVPVVRNGEMIGVVSALGVISYLLAASRAPGNS